VSPADSGIQLTCPNSQPCVQLSRPKHKYKNSLKQLNPGTGKADALYLYAGLKTVFHTELPVFGAVAVPRTEWSGYEPHTWHGGKLMTFTSLNVVLKN